MDINTLSGFNGSKSLREKLAAYGSVRTFDEGEVIQKEHAYIQAIPIVLSGLIKVMQTDEDNREMLLYYITPGESCIMSFLGGIHHDTSKISAIAEERTEILFIPIDKVHLLIRENPEWLDYIFRLYHKRFEELLETVKKVAFQKLDQRLADLLARKAELAQQKRLTITHEQLAQELGTSRVVVSRLLKEMENAGQVKLARNTITMLG